MAIMNTSSPTETHTIESYIKAGSGTPTITWYNFAILQPKRDKDNTAEYQLEVDNLINDYMDVIELLLEKVPLSQDEQMKYYYNPELLAYDLYGSTEFDSFIMKINGIVDPMDFDMPVIKLMKKSDLVEICSDIYNAERRYIQDNRKKYNLKFYG